MFRRSAINSEEFIFYLDLEADYLKKKNLIKSISHFVKEKEKFNSTTSYGMILFQTNDNPATSYDELDSEIITDLIDQKWEARETTNSYFENGLFEALSYIFRKSREARKNYRVIVITDTPSTLSEEYHNALYDLLIKARFFNTFIDIIRVGAEKFYDDDVKLKVITSETHGGVFYCNEARLFQDILLSLVQNKSEFTVIQPDDQNPIQKEDQIFYEKLAVDLITLDQDEEEVCDICEKEMCPICDAYSDEIHKCFNCNAKYHACCAAEYAIANPIGFKHLFRCIKCDTLLKLDADLVELIYREEYEEFEQELEKSYSQENRVDEELNIKKTEEVIIEDLKPKLEVSLDSELDEKEEEIKITLPTLRKPPSLKPTFLSPSSEDEVIEKKVKIGGYFGQEITVKTKVNNDKIVSFTPKTMISIANDNTQSAQPISITSLRPPKKTTIKLCKICGFTLNNAYICPKCGAKLD
ncbi:MAG: hypothetical protein ACFFKA_16015, partial [Candidatus Thorarchaeota archaeon]